MGSLSLFSVLPVLVLAFSVCHEAHTFQEYWNIMLPNTPMPAVRDHLGEPTAVSTEVEGHKHGTNIDSTPDNGDSSKSTTGLIPGADGKAVILDFGIKRVFTYSNNGDEVGQNKLHAGVISSIDGKPITGFGNKPVIIYSNKGDGGHDDKPNVGVISSIDGKPITVDFGDKPIFIYSKSGDGADGKPNGGIISGINGKSVAIGFGTKPIFIYSNNGDGVSQDKPNVGVISNIDGKPIIVDFSGKPVFIYSNNGDGVGQNMPNVGVISSIDGKPINIDFGDKPIFIYSNNGDGVDHKTNAGAASNINGKSVTDRKPLLVYSRKANAGSKANRDVEIADGHSSMAHDNIVNPKASMYFLEKDLHVGAKMKMNFDRGLSGDMFLHREIADTIPFFSDKSLEILQRFAVQPGSPMAETLEGTLHRCEEHSTAEKKMFCATSFESMIEFVISSLGTNDLGTLTSIVGRDVPEQMYTVQSWVAVPALNLTSTACHARKYPYTIFQCHWIPQTRPYVVKLVGDDGTTVDAAAVCHADTSAWPPQFYVLKAFGLRPGEATVCHLVPEGDVIWYPHGAKAVADAVL